MSFADAVLKKSPAGGNPHHSNEPLHFISTGGNDKKAVEYLNELFPRAAREGVSDVHFEDSGDNCFIRFRNRGVLEIVDVVATVSGLQRENPNEVQDVARGADGPAGRQICLRC